jgi:hypothetical protein
MFHYKDGNSMKVFEVLLRSASSLRSRVRGESTGEERRKKVVNETLRGGEEKRPKRSQEEEDAFGDGGQ